jgi:uncharacterized protein YraI
MEEQSMARKILLLLAVLISFAGVQAQGNDCPAELQTNLEVGASVQTAPGAPLNMRRLPSRSADLLGQADPADVLAIQDGPACAEGFAWWQVDRTGFVGWVAEGRVNPDGSFAQYYLYPEGLLAPADDLAVVFETDAFSGRTSTTDWGAVSRRENTLFPGFQLIEVEDYLSDTPEAMADFNTEGLFAGLRVEPVDFYTHYVPSFWEQLEALHGLLAEQPATPAFVPAPFVTFDDEQTQRFVTQVAYIPFVNGTGVRFLTAYTEDESELTYISYDFQGITDDGRYYVNGDFPVYSEDLDLDMTGDDYAAYITGVVDQLNALAPDAFAPSLTALDESLATLEVTGSDGDTPLAAAAG